MTSATTGPGLPSATPTPPATGLWLANQLCDLVQIRSFAAGTVVRFRFHLCPERLVRNPLAFADLLIGELK